MDRTWALELSHAQTSGQQHGDFVAQPQLCPRSPAAACTPGPKRGPREAWHWGQALRPGRLHFSAVAGPDKGVTQGGLTCPPPFQVLSTPASSGSLE